MLIFPRSWREHKHLADIAPDDKQTWVNDVYNMPIHELSRHASDPYHYYLQRDVSYQGRSMIFLATLPEVLELCPPERSAAGWVDLTNPPFLPIWVCHWHGKQVLVYTPEELAQELARTPQCYGPTRLGPWHGASADPWPWPWDPGKGLFAPAPYRETCKSYAPGGDYAVCTRLYLAYNRMAVPRGALFFLDDPFNDFDLRKTESVIAVESNAKPIQHELTGWWFMNQGLHDDYARCYETGDLTGIAWTVWPPEDTAPTREPVQESAATLEPQRQDRTFSKSYEPSYYKDKDVFAADVRSVYFDYCGVEGEPPDRVYVASHLKIPISVKTMNRYHDHWKLPYPPQP